MTSFHSLETEVVPEATRLVEIYPQVFEQLAQRGYAPGADGSLRPIEGRGVRELTEDERTDLFLRVRDQVGHDALRQAS